MKLHQSLKLIAALSLSTSLTVASVSAAILPPKPEIISQQEHRDRINQLRISDSETLDRRLEVDHLQRKQKRLEELLSPTEAQVLLNQQTADAVAGDSKIERIEAALQSAAKKLNTLISGADLARSRPIICGDSLHIWTEKVSEVANEPSVRGAYIVRRGGYIILPAIGRVHVAGLDVAAAEKVVKEALDSQAFEQGKTSINRVGYPVGAKGVIYLSGEFAKPGEIELPGANPTVVTAIAKAGPMTPQADLTRVKLLRVENGVGVVEEVNVEAIMQGVGGVSDIPVKSGDVLTVPTYAPTVYVTGKVNAPDQHKLLPTEQLGAFSAIARSGGFSDGADAASTYIVRERGNGEKVKIPVDITDVQSGQVPDVILQGSDIVVVPAKRYGARR